MTAAYSMDLREKAVSAIDRGERKSHVCRTLNISRNTLDQWLQLREEKGNLAPKEYRRGPKPKIDDLEAFKVFAEANGHLTQNEMSEKWDKPVSPVLIRQALSKINFTRKKKTYGYRERDEQKRQEFRKLIRTCAKERFVYIDEAGIDNTIDYPYGYCHKSERFLATKLGHRTERLSIISGWRDGEIIAPMLFEGYCNTALVCKWVEEFLVPELLPNQILVIDNASFHPQERIRQLVLQAGCEVIFLPPYSPDLNKIEKFWARLKNYVSKIIGKCESLWDAVQQAFCHLS